MLTPLKYLKGIDFLELLLKENDMHKLLVAIGITLSSVHALAAPQLNVGSMYDYVAASKTTEVKRIMNSGSSTAYVRVSVAEIVYDSNGKSSEVAAGEILDVSKQTDTLIASPARLIIPAGSSQTVRLLYMGNRDKERYFRVRYIPVAPDINDQFNLSEKEAEEYKKQLDAGFSIMAGYGTIVMVHPEKTKFDTQVIESDSNIKVTNKGNSTAIVDMIRYCDNSGLNCTPVRVDHLLPGREKTYEKMSGKKIYFDIKEFDVKKPYSF